MHPTSAFVHLASAFVHAQPEPTADLAARQAELVAALVAGGPDPAGFDADRLAVARRALLRKRAGEVATVWPALAASLGTEWSGTFAGFAADRAPAGALRDGWDLARALHRRGRLDAAAAVELAGREVVLRYRDGRRRRFPSARRAAGGIVVQCGGRIHHLGVR